MSILLLCFSLTLVGYYVCGITGSKVLFRTDRLQCRLHFNQLFYCKSQLNAPWLFRSHILVNTRAIKVQNFSCYMLLLEKKNANFATLIQEQEATGLLASCDVLALIKVCWHRSIVSETSECLHTSSSSSSSLCVFASLRSESPRFTRSCWFNFES